MAELTKDDDGGYIERIKTVEKEYPDLEAALRNLDKEHDSGDNYGNKTDIMLLKPDVQGFDDRDRVTNCGARHDTRTVVAIASSYSWAYCTGTLIAPDVVLTAGHCIYEDGAWNWPQHIFIHACGASDTTRRYSAKQMFTWTRWTRNEDPNWDIGVIKLHPSGGRHAGDRYGWKSFGYVSDIASALSRPRVTGYPGDKQRSVERLSMWSDEDRYSSSSRAHHLVFYRTDTSGANSGSGVHQNGRSVIYAVHAYGDTPDNAGVRIRSGIFSQICSWISNRRVC
jgi:V8-like Glu-specific endopeptidase